MRKIKGEYKKGHHPAAGGRRSQLLRKKIATSANIWGIKGLIRGIKASSQEKEVGAGDRMVQRRKRNLKTGQEAGLGKYGREKEGMGEACKQGGKRGE